MWNVSFDCNVSVVGIEALALVWMNDACIISTFSRELHRRNVKPCSFILESLEFYGNKV